MVRWMVLALIVLITYVTALFSDYMYNKCEEEMSSKNNVD